jgi:Arc/MetJ-type ribon-helix-helix transcriptional regulator
MRAIIRCKVCGYTIVLRFNKYSGVPPASRVWSKLKKECPVCGRSFDYPRLVDVLVGRESEIQGVEVDASQSMINVRVPTWMKEKLEELSGPGDMSELIREAIARFTPKDVEKDIGYTRISFKVPAHMKLDLEMKARMLGESVSSLVRTALEELIKEKEVLKKAER